MRFVVIGAGAVGGVVGGRLAQHGREVVLVARRTPAEGDELDGLDDAARRQRFVLEVAASGMVWGLYGDTWARSPAAGGAEALPFWSSAGQAARCSTGAWEGFVPRAIERDAFVEQWLAGMDEDASTPAAVQAD